MSRTWLLLDGNYLAYRAFFALGDLSHKEVPTGVLYGFFRDISVLMERFATNHIAFAFDHGVGIREKTYPIYKAKRRMGVQLTEKELQRLDTFKQQIWKLKEDFLTSVGWKNVYFHKGYEADDVIASMVRDLPTDDEAIIVSADKDMWQLVKRNVSCYNPQTKKSVTLESFYAEWNLQPISWRDVKAIAGCTSDNVPGVEGVGEITAAKYLTGKLTGKKAQAIIDFRNSLLYNRNANLVYLPYTGTPFYKLQEDKLDVKAWKELMRDLGIKSLAPPIARREYRKGEGLAKVKAGPGT